MTGRRYTEAEKAFFQEFVPGHSHNEILEAFNAKFDNPIVLTQVKSFIKNNNLNTGRSGYFPKGHEPYNKGKHGPEYGHKPTCYKKGHRPHNHKPVGSTRVTDGYILIKVAEPNKWRSLHIVVWEKANGPVPKAHVIVFGDGNKQNTALDNLILITRAELAMLNKFGLIGESAELTRTGVLVADLRMKIHDKRKRKN